MKLLNFGNAIGGLAYINIDLIEKIEVDGKWITIKTPYSKFCEMAKTPEAAQKRFEEIMVLLRRLVCFSILRAIVAVQERYSRVYRAHFRLQL